MNEDTEMQNKRSEYTEALQLLRHYSSLRFVMLPIFLAIVGALLGFIMPTIAKSPSEKWTLYAAGTLGISTSLSFLVFEYVIDGYLKVFGERAIELEKELKYSLWSRRTKPAKVLAKAATSTLFIGGLLVWIAVIVYALLI